MTEPEKPLLLCAYCGDVIAPSERAGMVTRDAEDGTQTQAFHAECWEQFVERNR